MSNKIAVIGLGYVGLPLASLFATKYPVVGFDINSKRINEIRSSLDSTLQLDSDTIKNVLTENHQEIGLFSTDDSSFLKTCNYYIVTVPTPVDIGNKPDLSLVYEASSLVGKFLKKNDIVIFESTVYPGVTEEECGPILEEISGLKLNEDFFVGYSPERINPGDKEHTIEKILKITSGSTDTAGKKVDELYRSVIQAGTYLAPSIKVAEAAKVIENSQRDINIAFVNELSKIFNLMGIDTSEVIKAAATKWNFLPFKPGLVGGHCIGVDPYYLAHKSQSYGYHPEIILAGRRINDGMGKYVASEIIKAMILKNVNIRESEVLILGITFKENCPDVRNTGVTNVVKHLKSYGVKIDISDPWASPEIVLEEYGLEMIKTIPKKKYDGIVLAVNHTLFNTVNYDALKKKNSMVYDIVNGLSAEQAHKL